MKNYIPICLALFLASKTVLMAQNWAPFQFDKKIIYTTPDTMNRIIAGKSMFLVQFDTSYFNQGMLNRSCKNCALPFYMTSSQASIPTASNYRKSLYGVRIEKNDKTYTLINDTLNSGSYVTYFSDAGIGSIICSSPFCTGTVVSKNIRFAGGQIDSVKVVALSFLEDPVETVVVEISKSEGFLKFPYFFHKYPNKRNIYSRFGNFDSDYKGIKSFEGEIKKFELYDEFSTFGYINMQLGISLSVCGYSKTNSRVNSIIGDSCIIEDSTFGYNCNLINPYYRVGTRKILNSSHDLGNYSPSPSEYLTTLSTSSNFSSWKRVKCGFIAEDNFVFVNMDGKDGLVDFPSDEWVSTQFPIGNFITQYSFGSAYGENTTTYFKRGNTVFGQPFNLTFTSNQEKIENSYGIYPNPATDQIFVKSASGSPILLSIYNLQGKIIIESQIENTNSLNIQSLHPGLYFYSIQAGAKVFKGRFLKEK